MRWYLLQFPGETKKKIKNTENFVLFLFLDKPLNIDITIILGKVKKEINVLITEDVNRMLYVRGGGVV